MAWGTGAYPSLDGMAGEADNGAVTDEGERREFVVADDEAGRRLDVVLVSRIEGLSRARARRVVDAGLVTVDGRTVRRGRALRGGERVVVEQIPAPVHFAALPDPDLPLPILHEDEHVVVADKPAGIPSHPLRRHERRTAAGALVARYPEMATVGYSPREPGIIHRLDTDTSGCLVAARDQETFEALRQQLRAGRIDKHYVALCAGHMTAPQRIAVPLGARRSDPSRAIPCPDPARAAKLSARPAVTEVLSSTAIGTMSLVTVRASTATRHQIRAHLAHVGHPLAGDALYGGPEVAGLERHFLHASEVSFMSPASGEEVRASAPLPEELRRLVQPESG